jgi:hypothetical protein
MGRLFELGCEGTLLSRFTISRRALATLRISVRVPGTIAGGRPARSRSAAVAVPACVSGAPGEPSRDALRKWHGPSNQRASAAVVVTGI